MYAAILVAQSSPQKDFERILCNVNYLYNLGRVWNTACEPRFAGIEERLGQLELHPLMLHPERLQVQIEQLAANAAKYLDAPPPTSPP